MQVDEANHDPQHLSNPYPPEEQDPQITKDDNKGKDTEMKDGQKGATALKRHPSESSSLRDFLDCPAVVPLADNTCDPLYNGFFLGDSPPAPLPQQHEPPQNSVPKFGSIFMHKTKDGKDKMRSQPDSKKALHGVKAECSVDLQLDANPHELTPKCSGTQKDSLENPVTDSVSILTPIAQPGASATHSRQQIRGPLNRMHKAFMRRRERSTAQAQGGLERTGVTDRHSSDRAVCTNLQDALRATVSGNRSEGLKLEARIEADIYEALQHALSSKQMYFKEATSSSNAFSPSTFSGLRPSGLKELIEGIRSMVVNSFAAAPTNTSPGENNANLASLVPPWEAEMGVFLVQFSHVARLPEKDNNHPGSIEVATVAPSSTGSPIPVSAHASAQPSDSCSTTPLPGGPTSDQLPPIVTMTPPTIDTSTTPVHGSEAPSQAPSLTVSSPQPQATSSMHTSSTATASCAPSSSTAAVPCPPCPPQEDDLALPSVLSPEEIRMIHEHRRRNGTSAEFSACPEDDHQSPAYSGLSPPLPAQFQCPVTPSLRVSSHSSRSYQLSNSRESLDLTTSAGDTIEHELGSDAQQDDIANSEAGAGAFNSYIDLPEFQNPWQ
ncbi:hypothetical protein BU15DRAFT_78117 [Melanogaster broomeanus]|nr:hypothetical protein BU15DRAFT_78117 [Melanogaster broomeanus]